MNKRDLRFIDEYEKSQARDLRDVYKSYSHEKEFAMKLCCDMMEAEGGWGLKILSANTFHFTVAWVKPENVLHVVTRNNDYYIDLDKLPF